MEASGPIAEIAEELERYPEERYPVQHATAQFRLGSALLDAGDLDDALVALRAAERLLQERSLSVEHAKVLNALGAASRLSGRSGEAAALFRRAAASFEADDLRLEQGAALFNLGLVEREGGRPGVAAEALRSSRALLDSERVPVQASAAARELGSALLAIGEPKQAVAELEEAVRLAGRCGDEAALGAAANALGLARLALGDEEAAVGALQDAVAAHPRSVRPAEHAMARANLALAYERSGQPARAVLSAGQALAVSEAPGVVVEQADAVRGRIDLAGSPLLAVLLTEPEGRWPALLREELARWAELGADERLEVIAAWFSDQHSHPELVPRLAEVLLAGLLELPPEAMQAVIEDVVRALGAGREEGPRRLRSGLIRGMAAFQPPQEKRLRQSFADAAAAIGAGRSWS